MSINILWIEDDEQQLGLWRESLERAFDVRARFSNHYDALEFAKKHGRKIEAVITDLRILSGPTQPDYPPIHTPYVYGIKLVEDLGHACPNIPVVAYSRFLDAGSPTRQAIDTFLDKEPSNLLNIYKTPLKPSVAIREMLHLLLSYLRQADTQTLKSYVTAHRPTVIEFN